MAVGLLIILLSIATSLIYLLYKKNERYIKLGNQIPGLNLWQSIKILPATKGSPMQMFETAIEVSSAYPKILKIWGGYRLIVGLFNPEDVEIILSSHSHLEKSDEYKYFAPWFGNGLLISYGDIWKHHRKMIAPTFHMNILKSFIPAFNKISLDLCGKLKREIGKPFDCHEYMSGTTVDILLDTVMGYKEKRSEDSGFQYAMAVMKMCSILHQRSYKPWLRYDTIFKNSYFSTEHDKLLSIIHDLTNKAVDYRKKDHIQKKLDVGVTYSNVTKEDLQTKEDKISGYNNGTAVRDDLDYNDENDIGERKRLAFLDALTQAAMQEGINFTEKEVRDQVSTIMFEGHDTTAAGSSFALCMLGVHQDIQDKVVQELNDIFQKSDRPVTFADTIEMKLLERVIMETLRLYPPVPIIARRINEECKLASGDYTLPVGATVIIAPYLLHKDPKSFPNPDVFNPDNFLPEKCQERHFYSYVPFSAGPRSCVGRKYAMLKLKVLLATILRKYKIKSTIPEKDFKLQGDIILKRADGFMIEIQERV